jgi:hypothetical protein
MSCEAAAHTRSGTTLVSVNSNQIIDLVKFNTFEQALLVRE